MYSFTPYATENQLKSNADNYNVELISNDKTIRRTEWKITRVDGVYGKVKNARDFSHGMN